VELEYIYVVGTWRLVRSVKSGALVVGKKGINERLRCVCVWYHEVHREEIEEYAYFIIIILFSGS
jgi:hypothetical protein